MYIIYIHYRDKLGHMIQSCCTAENQDTAYSIADLLYNNSAVECVDIFDTRQGHFIGSRKREY